MYYLDKKATSEWPLHGRILFKNFYLRYGIDTPFVIKNLNVQIEPMEKVIQNVYQNKL